MQTNYDRDTIMPLYEKSAGQSRSPLRRVMYLWRKPMVRWVVLMFIVIFTFVTTHKLRRGPLQPEPVPVEENNDANKKPKRPPGKVFHWDLCPQLIAELDEARGPDYRYPHGAHNDSNSNPADPLDESEWARVLPATKLIAMAKRGEKVPQNIIHQSWKRHQLPKDFERWSKDWKRLHGKDWTYVLWTDDDNRHLMTTFYPEYLETYNALPKEIYRADMVRNGYMHRFGGVYADLDMVPLTSMQDRLPIFNRDRSNDPLSVVYLGHMGSYQDRERWGSQNRYEMKMNKFQGKDVKKYEDDDEDDEDDWDTFEHSIPNAFMIATKPGHPLWLQAFDYVKDHLQYVVVEETSNESDNAKATNAEEEETEQKEVILLYEPEKLTGPVALKRCVKEWNKLKSRKNREAKGIFDQVVVLPDSKIYPFSWYDESNLEQCLCRRHSPHLDEKKCNSLYPDAWAITYWTHSWDQ